jgi:hypothetical protein
VGYAGHGPMPLVAWCGGINSVGSSSRVTAPCFALRTCVRDSDNLLVAFSLSRKRERERERERESEGGRELPGWGQT